MKQILLLFFILLLFGGSACFANLSVAQKNTKVNTGKNADIKSYSLQGLGTIKLPANWRNSRFIANSTAIYNMESGDPKQSPWGHMCVIITRAALDADAFGPEKIAASVEVVATAMNRHGGGTQKFKPVSYTAVNISGQEALFITGDGMTVDSFPLRFDLYYIRSGGAVLSVLFQCPKDHYADLVGVFREIVYSIDFGGKTESKLWRNHTIPGIGSISAQSDWSLNRNVKPFGLKHADRDDGAVFSVSVLSAEDGNFEEDAVAEKERQLTASDQTVISYKPITIYKQKGALLTVNKDYHNLPGREVVYMTSGKSGVIKFTFRCTEQDYEENKELFDAMIKTLRLAK